MHRLEKGLRLAVALCAIVAAAFPLGAGTTVQVRIASPDIGERVVKVEKGYMFTVPTRARPGFELEGITDQLGDIYHPGQNIAVNYDLVLTYRWSGQPSPESDFTWRPGDGGIVVTGYKGGGGSVQVPRTFGRGGERTATIGWGAFSDNASLVSVVLPSGLRNIESYAFAECAALVSADLPAGLEKIGYCAFENCSKVVSVRIPASVVKVDAQAFKGWRSSQTIIIAKGTDTKGWDSSWSSGCGAEIVLEP